MTQTRPNDCTEYKSLYPTDSANQQIAIPRIASAPSNSDARVQSESSHADQAPRGLRQDLMPVQRIFQPQASALRDLVEVLHQILLDVPETGAPAGVEATCFSAAPE